MSVAGTSRRHPEAGFTLIEALVAMAVLALGAVSLLTATEGHTARITGLTDRIYARWAGEARLTELRLGLGAPGTVEMGGHDWIVADGIAGTSDPDLARVTVTVAPVDTPESTTVTLTGYIATADLPEAIR